HQAVRKLSTIAVGTPAPDPENWLQRSRPPSRARDTAQRTVQGTIQALYRLSVGALTTGAGRVNHSLLQEIARGQYRIGRKPEPQDDQAPGAQPRPDGLAAHRHQEGADRSR